MFLPCTSRTEDIDIGMGLYVKSSMIRLHEVDFLILMLELESSASTSPIDSTSPPWVDQ